MKLYVLFCVLDIFKHSFPVYVFFKSCLYQIVYRHNIVNNAAVISSIPFPSLKFVVHILVWELVYSVALSGSQRSYLFIKSSIV
jgi:hypothetical protein